MGVVKTCTKCLLPSPADIHHFPPRRDSPDGLNTRCRQCESTRRETSRKKLIESRALTSAPPAPHIQGSPATNEVSPRLPRAGKSTVLCIPDIHFPWHSERGLALLYDLAAVGQPNLIIQLGDLYDLLAFSRFSRSHNLYTPAEELDSARRHAVSMWRRLAELCPRSKRVQIRGNHDDRASKRVAEVLPEIEHLVTPAIAALFQFDGVETFQDSRMEYEFEGVLYQHGHMPGGRHFLHNMQPTVTGHTHKGGTWYKALADQTIWELNAGFLGDHHAPVFSYHAQARLHGTTLGCGWIDQYGPRFIPFD